MHKRRTISILLLAAGLIVSSCANMKVLKEGEYRLAQNSVKFVDYKGDIVNSDIAPYIKQQTASFNLFGTETVVFDSSLVANSIENITSHLKYLGYYHSDVRAEIKTKNKNARVTYFVHPDGRFPIDKVTYKLPDNEEFGEFFYADTANVTIKPGSFLSEHELESESERSASYFRRNGYYGFTNNYYFYEADTLSTPGSASLVMEVREYTRNENPLNAAPLSRSTIGKVNIRYPERMKFDEDVLRKLNIITPGTMYDEKNVNTTYNRLSALRVFNGVNIELNKADSSTVDCNINLSPSKTRGFKINLEGSTNSSGLIGVSPQLSYYNKNFFHGGEWLNLGFMGNFQFKLNQKDTHSEEFGVSAGISFPKFLGLPYTVFRGPNIPRTDLKLSFNYQDRPEYLRKIFSFSFGYNGNLYNHFAYQLYPLQMNLVSLSSLDPEFQKTLDANPFMKYSYQNHFDMGIGGDILYSPNVTSLKKDKTIRFSFDVSGNFLSIFKGMMPVNSDGYATIGKMPYTQYARAEVSFARTIHIGAQEKHSFAGRILFGAGYAYGNSSAMPFEKQFYCGGANSMRGWQSRTLGPGASPMSTSFLIPSQTGDIKIEANIEYRNKLFWKLEPALFVDVGNVWNINSPYEPARFHFNNFYKTLAADWGLGLRLDIEFLVIRIDMGFRMFEPSRPEGNRWVSPKYWFEDAYALHFGVGYPF